MTQKALPILIAVAALATACGGQSIASIGDEIQRPDAFVEVERETTNTFDGTVRSYSYTTDVSQDEACALAEAALQEWAGDGSVELAGQTPNRPVCIYEVMNPERFPDIDSATATVNRIRTGGEFDLDGAKPGGVESVNISLLIRE